MAAVRRATQPALDSAGLSHLLAEFVQQCGGVVFGIQIEQIVQLHGQTHDAADAESVVAHAQGQVFRRAPADLALALAGFVAVGLAVIDHDLLQKLADLLGRVLGGQLDDLLSWPASFQGQAVVAAGDGEEEEEGLAVRVGQGVVSPAVLGEGIGLMWDGAPAGRRRSAR